MNYPDSVRFLYALGNEMKSVKFGLDRIRAILAALGNPETAYRIVHVAGTNGKGSTCAMVDAGLQAAGIRTGLFTSPHLVEPAERIQINGIPVTEGDFTRAFNVVHQAARSLDLDCHPTYFETVTAMGFWLFREKGIHTAVVEVGLGGRLDATNVVHPTLSVITPIDFDHEVYLGNTIEAIAGEKAGILKPGVLAVFARQRPEAAAVLDARATQLGIRVRRAADVVVEDLEIDARGSRFMVGKKGTDRSVHTRGSSKDRPYSMGDRVVCPLFLGPVVCPLAGEHQIDNAVTAALALDALGISPKGIAEARWPGRLEHISPNPDVILDGAHNPAGARALARYLERFYSDRKRWIVYGAMRDKSIEEIAGILFPLGDELIFTAPESPRALRPEALVELAGCGRATPNIAAALEVVQGKARAEDVIVITGSLFLVGEARAASYNKNSWPFSGAWS
ncbi:MAG TPA: folylpolyglutamate synthase/dihydrofolate synthase family protein [Bryobacteraceae bacterium]|nr:folylpolyglutamate synthase/dihydrofolate synthase family protein [Bryobacteraceae bacterium]